MPATAYKVWAWGDPVGGGTQDAVHVGIAAVGKRGNAEQPYAVANEIFAVALARALFLPCPPSIVVEKEHVPHSVSLNFNLTGMDLPPADCEALVERHPGLAAGIVLFDEWILNHDRHPENIAFDEIGDRVQIFDHGHAFRPAGLGVEFLESRRGLTALHLSPPIVAFPYTHCLAPHLPSLDPMEGWQRRIMDLPEWMVDRAVRAGCELGWPDSDHAFCVEFLLERRERLMEIIRANRDLFVNAQDSLPLAEPAAPVPRSRRGRLWHRLRRRTRPVATPDASLGTEGHTPTEGG